MFGTNDREVAPIECRDRTHAKSFSERDHGCIDCRERKITISADEFRDSHPIARMHRFSDEISGSEIAEESHFG